MLTAPIKQTFPIMMNQKEWNELNTYNVPKDLPMKFMAQFRVQVMENHYQTLERLAERGGLCPTEICAAMYNLSFHIYWGHNTITIEQKKVALRLISLQLAKFNKDKNE